jgi:uncharacterized protein
MHPIFFGRSDHQLFGIYHGPARSRGRKGVVLCYPWGQEYMRAHRAFRFLGDSLAKAGIHVIRFDYWGTGDSGGDLCEADPPTWTEDVALAAQELMDTADLSSVSLCGLRMGAHWAARSAVELPEVERVVLWDPVVDGKQYVEELMTTAASIDDRWEVDGFTLTPAVRDSLATASERDFLNLRVPTMVLRTGENAGIDALVPKLRARDDSITSRVSPAPPAWKEERGDFGTSGMPVAAFGEIADWLNEG